MTYPVAIAGIIGSLLGLRRRFGIDAVAEGRAFEQAQRTDVEPLELRTRASDFASALSTNSAISSRLLS